MNQETKLEPPENEERWVERRTQFLDANEDFREPECRAIAWSELGYSSSGIAKHMDSTEGTVKKYLRAVEKRHGVVPLYPRQDDFDEELTIEDRTEFLGMNCPQCHVDSLLRDEDALEGMPNPLKAVENESGELFALREGGEVFLPDIMDRVEKFGKEVDARKKFLANEYDLICIWCLWQGNWGDLES